MHEDADTLLGTWHDGREVSAESASWGAVTAAFLGCGYRVTFPFRPGSDGPVDHAERSARRVAELFGTTWDTEAWRAVRERLAGHSGRDPWTGATVLGGWSYGLDRRFGSPWTRLHTGPGPGVEVAHARAVQLPWTRETTAPTATMPMISALADARADAYVEDRGADLGLWTDHRGEVVGSTVGCLLVATRHGWTTPGAGAELEGGWPWSELRAALGAEPSEITPEDLAGAGCVAAVSTGGGLAVLVATGGRAMTVLERRRDELTTARDQVLPGL